MITLIFLAALSAFANPMTQVEREHLVAHLKMTQSWLTDEVSTLSAAQLNFGAAPDRWTVAEVVQHLVVARAGDGRRRSLVWNRPDAA